MNDINEVVNKLLAFIPEKYRGFIALLIATSPYISRAIYSVRNGGGLKGIIRAIWLGTNVPKIDSADKVDSSAGKNLNTLILCAFLSVGIAGCSSLGANLADGGAYSPVVIITTTNAEGVVTVNASRVIEPDFKFFVADSAFDIASGVVIGVFKFEKENRAAIFAVTPKIKHELDKVRPVALDIIRRYGAARKIYIKNPTPAGIGKLEATLLEIQKVSLIAQTIIAIK